MGTIVFKKWLFRNMRSNQVVNGNEDTRVSLIPPGIHIFTSTHGSECEFLPHPDEAIESNQVHD